MLGYDWHHYFSTHEAVSHYGSFTSVDVSPDFMAEKPTEKLREHDNSYFFEPPV
jgi:hypothetical protein